MIAKNYRGYFRKIMCPYGNELVVERRKGMSNARPTNPKDAAVSQVDAASGSNAFERISPPSLPPHAYLQ